MAVRLLSRGPGTKCIKRRAVHSGYFGWRAIRRSCILRIFPFILVPNVRGIRIDFFEIFFPSFHLKLRFDLPKQFCFVLQILRNMLLLDLADFGPFIIKVRTCWEPIFDFCFCFLTSSLFFNGIFVFTSNISSALWRVAALSILLCKRIHGPEKGSLEVIPSQCLQCCLQENSAVPH